MAAQIRERPLTAAATLASAAALIAVLASRGPELVGALGRCSVAAALGAIAVHAATLACRCEAWRLAASAIDDRPLPRAAAHLAGGTGAAAGMLQGAGTAPARALAMRRLDPAGSPRTAQLLVAELPVFLGEAALIAIVLGLSVFALPIAPGWAGPAAVLGSAGALVGLRWWARRCGDGAAAGLRVLADRRRRGPMATLLVAVTALGVARAWLVLLGLGLPHTAATAGLAFIALGVFGLLPVGPGSTPAAMLAVAGSADPTAAVAAGIAITATSWVGVAIYASIGASVWAASKWPLPFGGPRSSASKVDQPKWRAASPSPSSGL